MLLAILVVAGIVAVVAWQPWRAWADAEGSPAQAAPTSAPASTAPAGTPIPTSPAPGSPAPTATPGAPATTPPADDEASADDDTEILPCTTADVTVAATVDKSSYGTKELPKLSITLTNDAGMACLINVGTTSQRFEITSGSDTWWRSTDCQTEPSDQVVKIEAGQKVSSATPLVWDRTRSSADSCDGKRQNALPGWYNLTVSVGGIESVEPAQFTLR